MENRDILGVIPLCFVGVFLGGYSGVRVDTIFIGGVMFRMGSGELLVVVFVAMLFLGPEQIKSLVKRWAETMKAVKHTMQQITDETSQTNE